MGNPSKHKGTDFESGCVNYMRSFGIPCERVPLHGSKDHGDLRFTVGGLDFTGECKRVERVSDAELAKFRLQTQVESDNAGTEGGVLFVWRKGKGYRWDASPTGQRSKSFGQNVAHMTVGTLLAVCGHEWDDDLDDYVLRVWVSMPLWQLVDLATRRIQEVE